MYGEGHKSSKNYLLEVIFEVNLDLIKSNLQTEKRESWANGKGAEKRNK